MATITSPPQQLDLAFLPHGPGRAQYARSPSSGFLSLPAGPSRARSRSGTMTAPAPGSTGSRSAPNSPVNRATGLTPLSRIQPLSLSPVKDLKSLPIPLPGSSSTQLVRPRPPLHLSQSLPAHIELALRDDASSPSETSYSGSETEVDSDATFRPDRQRVRSHTHAHSKSQPDLTALKRDVEGWAGNVARGQLQERRIRSRGRKTPPQRLSSLGAPAGSTSAAAGAGSSSGLSSGGSSPVNSRSVPSLAALRGLPSPRHSSAVPPMTPLLSHVEISRELNDSPKSFSYLSAAGGMTGSSDADDDFDGSLTSSPSSGSLTFSPRRSRSLRQRSIADRRSSGGLGLSLGPKLDMTPRAREVLTPVARNRAQVVLQRTELWLMAQLPFLAIGPAAWGTCVLLQALVTGGLWAEVWPWGVDLSRERLERLLAGGESEVGGWTNVNRGDMLLCIAWAMCTGHFCFKLTAGLVHRWRSYYSTWATITRLYSVQCICYPATYATLRVLGASRPLLAWTVIGVTTGWSRCVQMWVTSNVSPESGTSDRDRERERERGDVTPRSGKRNLSSASLSSMALAPALGSSTSVRDGSTPTGLLVRPDDLSYFQSFTWGRRWDWDAVAREVGWKVGGLLLLTCAWLFWGIEVGRFASDL